MREVFAAILDNAMVAGIMILVIVLIRVFMRKMPKFICPLLWGLVGIKLLLPFDIHSSFGLLPGDKIIEYSGQEQAPVIVKTGLRMVDKGTNHFIGNNIHSPSATPVKGNFYDVCVYLWLAGIFVLFLYMLISCIVMRKVTSCSVAVEKNVRICDEIKCTFLLGIIRPQIYLPSGIEKDKYEYIVAHEKMHIKRGDHIWKISGFFLLGIYWFHPLCWIAYYLFCKDVEFACDEKVISGRDSLWRANYCQTLLECSTDRRKVMFVPLGFGEVGVKERVKTVMGYKKMKISIAILLILICGITVICFGTRHNDSVDINNSAKREEKVDNKSTEQEKIVGQKPTINLDDYPGADGTHLYYADENKIIFADYYGLFVYDTENHKYIQSVDLKPIGCDKTQGDDACEIAVNKDGTKVYLHVMSDKENMYEYSVENNTFVKKKYALDENDLYKGIIDDSGSEANFTTSTGKKNSCYIVNRYSNHPLGELGYIRYDPDADYDLVFPLFVTDDL